MLLFRLAVVLATQAPVVDDQVQMVEKFQAEMLSKQGIAIQVESHVLIPVEQHMMTEI